MLENSMSKKDIFRKNKGKKGKWNQTYPIHKAEYNPKNDCTN